MPRVLDASAMLAVVRNEPGAAVVAAALAVPSDQCFAHYVNLCEVFYTRTRQEDEQDAEAAIRYLLETAGVIPFESPEPEFYWEVARLRAFVLGQRLSLSLADCFCIATARALGCDLLTADHGEFDSVAPLGLCSVTFIR